MKQFNLEEYLNDPSKKVVTRDGRSARIICTNFTRAHNIIAQIEGNDFSASYHKDGIFTHEEESNCDLVFATERKEGWINIYKVRGYCYGGSVIYPTEVAAKTAADADDIVTIKIEWEE